jgi:hypothetical protein
VLRGVLGLGLNEQVHQIHHVEQAASVASRHRGRNDDEALTRESEMVKAYRDTWELGLHSYLTY